MIKSTPIKHALNIVNAKRDFVKNRGQLNDFYWRTFNTSIECHFLILYFKLFQKKFRLAENHTRIVNCRFQRTIYKILIFLTRSFPSINKFHIKNLLVASTRVKSSLLFLNTDCGFFAEEKFRPVAYNQCQRRYNKCVVD